MTRDIDISLTRGEEIDPHRPMRSTIERMIALGDQEQVQVAQILKAFGSATLTTALMIPALLVVSPLSGVPVFSSICGLSIALISGQMVFGRTHLWLPGWITRRRLNGARLVKALARMRSSADWLDKRTAPRLGHLTRAPLDLIPKTTCLVGGLTMPFLELIPFSSSLIGTAVALTSIGFLARDGLYVLIAGIFIGLAASVPWLIFALSTG